jgi:hypothetical protein
MAQTCKLSHNVWGLRPEGQSCRVNTYIYIYIYMCVCVCVCFVCCLEMDSSIALCNVEQFINPIFYFSQYFGLGICVQEVLKLQNLSNLCFSKGSNSSSLNLAFWLTKETDGLHFFNITSFPLHRNIIR